MKKAFTLVALLFLFLHFTASSLYSCDRSSLNLIGISQAGSGWDIAMEVNIGAGIMGVTTGADNNTNTFAFGFYVNCPASSSFLVNSWTPSFLTSDTTACTNPSALAGPAFGAVQTLAYISQGCFYTCVTNTLACGDVHTQTDTVVVNVSYTPDSIRLFGVEGQGNPVAGCYPNSDMLLILLNQPGHPTCAVDTDPPVISCPDTVFSFLGANCQQVVPDLTTEVNAYDCCTNPTISQAPAIGTSIANNSVVVVTATDSAGNMVSCPVVINFQDTIAPSTSCSADTFYLDGLGFVTVLPQDVGAATDNCTIASEQLAPGFFGCTNIGGNSVTYTAIDNSGLLDSCSAIVTILDTIAPTANCQNLTVYLDSNRTYNLNPIDINAGSLDNCGFPALNANPSLLDTSFGGTAVVTLVASDVSGNTSSCQSNVTILDTFAVGLEEGVTSIWRLSPNPTRDQVRLERMAEIFEEVEIEVINIDGRVVVSQIEEETAGAGVWMISLGELPKGVYFVRVKGKDWHWMQKVLKW